MPTGTGIAVCADGYRGEYVKGGKEKVMKL